MAATLDQVHKQALELSPQDQEELVMRLLDERVHQGKDDALSPEWMTEIRRRIEEVDTGKVQLRDGFEFLAELKKRFQVQ